MLQNILGMAQTDHAFSRNERVHLWPFDIIEMRPSVSFMLSGPCQEGRVSLGN